MFAIHVKNGTNAGRKRPYQGQPEPWQCDCAYRRHDAPTSHREHPGYLSACSDCGARRPV